MAYQQLTSERYWQESVQQEIKYLRRQRNRAAFQIFQNVVFAVVVVIGVGVAMQTMPNWLPSVAGFLEYYGVIPTTFPLN